MNALYQVKMVLKKTKLYPFYKRYIDRKDYSWTEQDERMLRFYSKFIKKRELCFDIGANIGNRSKIFLKLNARVVAVEPQQDCVDYLRERFSGNRRFYLVPQALGASEGVQEILISPHNTVSSMSQEWVAAVQNSNRFSNNIWNQKQIVQTITLDRLIQEFGDPVFIKIDVEGYEYEVIKGLTKPVNIISFEFTPEIMYKTFMCLDYLQSLGNFQVNYSCGESMEFMLNHWVSMEEIKEILNTLSNDHKLFGDIYVRYKR